MEMIKKAPTGIDGLDEILEGGLPVGRTVLVVGGPGCGKTMFAVEFLCRSAQKFGEPGLFVTFEERREDILSNFASCKFGFSEALAAQKLRIESIPLFNDFTVEAGEFTFDGLLVRLEHWLREINARRLALDSLNALFNHFSDSANLRYEYSRIFEWIRELEISAVITSQRGHLRSGDHQLEEYLSDCVIHMDHRVAEQISKRRLRVLKYRGSSHGTDEYPFLINAKGLSILPITALELERSVSDDYISTGVPGLDEMLGEKGYYRDNTVLISGGPGTGKSTLSMNLALNACRNGQHSLVLSFEESAGQVVRNMRMAGLDLEAEIEKGLLQIAPVRPSRFGLEEHLVRIRLLVKEFQPDTVVIDPITAFSGIGNSLEVRSMLIRVLDYIKGRGTNIILTSLTPGGSVEDRTEAEISSIVDVWIIIRFLRMTGESRRQIWVQKARGMAHSTEISEMVISKSGITVRPFLVPLTGSEVQSDT